MLFVAFQGDTYIKIGDSFITQPKLDVTPLIDTLWLYKGVLDSMPDLYHVSIAPRIVLLFLNVCRRSMPFSRSSYLSFKFPRLVFLPQGAKK